MDAAATCSEKQSFQEDNNNSNEWNLNKVKKQEIQSAIAKAMELRALHAALMQQQQANSNNSPNAHLRFPSLSPSAHHNPHFSAQDYPVFTPSYEDEPVHFGIEDGKENASSRKGLPCDLVLNLEAVAEEDQRSFTSSYANANHPTLLSASSPGPDFCKSKRNSLSEFRSVSATTMSSDLVTKKSTCKNLVVPLTDLHSSSVHSQPKSHGMMSFFRLFPMLNKKKHNKHSNSPNNRTDPDNNDDDDVSRSFKEFLSIEALKKELLEANAKRDIALTQVAEMRTSIGELSQKLEYLENYCEDLKKALKLAATTQVVKKSKVPKIDDKGILPVSEEAMIEGFTQMVSEARLSVKQFCKTLVEQIDETEDTSLTDSLNYLLLPYKLSLHQKLSKTVFYHLEAIMNQSLYKDFENCMFQNNGTPKFLDPQQDREFQFSSFVALRNLSWNEVLTKGTKYYSEELSKFCDQKMSYIIAAMNWTKPWPEQLLQAFFVTAKCIWLLHLLAFSFNPPLRILRVQENRSYDPHFMEDVAIDSHNSSRIKIMRREEKATKKKKGFRRREEVVKKKRIREEVVKKKRISDFKDDEDEIR